MISSGVMRITFKDVYNPNRWSVNNIPGFLEDLGPDFLTELSSVGYTSTKKKGEEYSFKLIDPVSGKDMFDTKGRELIFTDKYIEFGIVLPSQTLFGLGQHNAKFLLKEGNWTMFNRDQPGSPKAKGEGKQHLYGTHPFLMAKTTDNKFIGVLFYNSNPQQFYIEFSKSSKSVVTYRTIGGILDIYMFAADTAENIIKKYNELVSMPLLPPFWALGFHQCSWAYNSTTTLRNVVSNYTSQGYMFDAIWSDILYMDEYIDFTVDDVNYAGIKEFINELHTNHLQFVPIVDAGISIKTDSKGVSWYNKGTEMNVFIKTAQNLNEAGGNLIAQVWPGYTAFVDFLHPNAYNFWSQGLEALYEKMPYDGIWLDMNEPSNFCKDKKGHSVGECYPHQKSVDKNKSDRSEHASDIALTFTPGEVDLVTNTLSMDAIFTDPNEKSTRTYIMYNIHNMYGTLETMTTHKYLTSRDNKRQLIISRASFVGHGQYGSIWTGDNDANQNDMKLSINQIMNFNQFGMPFVGGDICGFSGNTKPELCARWAQVGAFYPFMRNHYSIYSLPHEFYRFDKKYQKGMKESIRQRYSLLRYYYTELYKSSKFGFPTVRHPMYDWSGIDQIVKDEISFMIGKHVRVIANFELDDTTPLKTYMPKGRWLDYQTYNLFKLEKDKTIELYNGWDYANVYIRGGSIVPFQNTSDGTSIKNTYDLLQSYLKFLIVPDDNHYAEGNLFIARGETTNETFQYYSMTYSNKKLQIRLDNGEVTNATQSENNEVLEEIQILDDDEDVLASDFVCAMTSDHDIIPLNLNVAKKTDDGQSYLKIHSTENIIQFDEIHAIMFGRTGVDDNICDRAYYATSTQSTSTVKSYVLKKGTSALKEKELTLTLKLLENNNIQLTITDGSNRFTVPKSALKDGGPNLGSGATSTLNDYVKVSNSTSKFILQIHEFQNPKSVYFEIGEDSLMFSEYYISLETEINSNGKIYGMGERVTDFFIKDGIYTSWALDQFDTYDDGKPPGENIYGVHPVYFTKSKTGNASHWGMFNLNANAQDTKVQLNTGKHGAKISHYISGQGIFDMYFFLDNSRPEDAIKKYHNVIGNTLLPPFWSLGWHQSKYGYKSTSVLKQVYNNYTDSNFPLDTLWSDIDHMLKYEDFIYDKDGEYKDLDIFVRDTLHQNNRKYVPIIDAGIAIVNKDYGVYTKGKKKNVFIKSYTTNNVLYGKVWPGYVAFPDWTRDSTTDWWIDSMNDFHSQIEFDGIWLDMNEVSNFCTGTCIPEDIVPPGESVLGKLIYSPGSRNLNEKSLSVDGQHSDGGIQLNYHSLFGLMQGETTHRYFSDQNLRSLIISRSTFAGQGKFTSHWLGDNDSTFDFLKYSISGIMNMNIFGINFVGADICGFRNVATEDL